MILVQIDRFLRSTRMPPSRLGRLAINDPRLVFDLRNGRELRPETTRRVLLFLATAGTSAQEGSNGRNLVMADITLSANGVRHGTY